MHPFALSKAKDLAEAVAAHAMDGQLAFIAGGTDLLGLMKDRAAHPERLLDINGLPDMGRIEALPDGGLRVGALARMSDLAADLEVRRRFPVIAESLLFAASGQLRNMATIGGNILQRTRCAYFRDEDDLPCNKRRPGSGCSARHGLNRNHAIFGWSDACVATHPSDLAVVLAALDAVVIVLGPRGRRLIQFADFHRLPGSELERDNVLERGDLIVAIEVPPRPEGRASHYLKVRDRKSYEFALASAAAAVTTEGRRIRSARLALGGVAHRPWRLAAAESALRGASLDNSCRSCGGRGSGGRRRSSTARSSNWSCCSATSRSATPSGRREPKLPTARLLPPCCRRSRPSASLCPIICRSKRSCTKRPASARPAAQRSSAGSAPMSAWSWNMCPHTSSACCMCARR